MCYEKNFNPLNQKKEIYNKCKCRGPNFTDRIICKLKIANSEEAFYSLSKLLEALQKNLNINIQIKCKCEQKEPEIEQPSPKEKKNKEEYPSIGLSL